MNWKQHQILMESEAITDPTEFGILVALISFADKDEALCWASKAKVAKRARLKLDARNQSRAADNAIKSLLKKGHISVISRGGGASENCYKVHILAQKEAGSETEIEPEIEPLPPHLTRGAETEAPPRLDTQPPHLNTQNGVRPPRLDTQNNSDPRVWIHAHKDEDQSKRNEELCGGGRVARGAPPPPQNSTLLFSPIGDAVFEVNGKRPDLANRRDAQELSALAEKVRDFPSEEAAAAEIIRRCEFWHLPDPPQLSQIVSHWEPMERREQSRKRHQENQNERLSPGASTPRFLTPKQQAAANRERERQRLGAA